MESYRMPELRIGLASAQCGHSPLEQRALWPGEAHDKEMSAQSHGQVAG